MSAAINRTYSPMYDETSPGINAQPSSSVVPISGWNDWQVAAVKKILAFRNLQPNWDSYGSRDMSNAVVYAAITFLGQPSFENVPAPVVLPVSGGAIQFEWAKGDRALEFEVRPNGSISYLAVENGEPVAERNLQTPADAEHWLSWLSVG